MSLNKIIINLSIKYFEDKDYYRDYCIYAKALFTQNKNISFNKELIRLLFLFFDYDTYKRKTKVYLTNDKGRIDLQIFEPLLYGFRFCVNSLYYEKNEKIDLKKLLYPSILTKNCKNVINNSLIPGDNENEDLHIKTFDNIQFHFKIYPDSCGCYVCSCGFYYKIDPCGFPNTNQTFNCPKCGLKCGYGPKTMKDRGIHGMVIRPGHYRIFKDRKQKVSQMSRWNDVDENIPNKFYEEYIRDVIDPIRNKTSLGFNVIERDCFEKQDKKIRRLSNIGYRLLNFISYCHLFYTYCLENMSKEDLDNYLIKNCDILKIIHINWVLLKEILRQKNVDSVQIFLNMIFKDLTKLIRKYEITKNNKDREKFENQIEFLIKYYLNKYPEYSKLYKEENLRQLDLNYNSLKTLVTELIHPSSECYTENEYPVFKYFNYTKYKSVEDMLIGMNNNNYYSYPLIRQLILDDSDVKKLKYLPAFNEFTNYMVNYYSFKISRKEAKKISLEEEDIIKEKGFNKKFSNFLKAWENIKSKAIKYKCYPQMEIKEKLSKNDKLINFLNDTGELNNGMYLASACQNFIEWQNTFLQPIVDSNTFNGILHNYVSTITNKILVQEANKEQIVLIKERFEKDGRYSDFIDVAYAFSERDIFGEDGKINYTNYNHFVYDYDKIEEELGKIILPGVCLFEGEDELNFVTYLGEGFRGKNSSIISKFYEKYPQKDLLDDEKKEIITGHLYMKKQFKYLFGSLQKLLFYLTEKVMVNENEKLTEIINNASEDLNLSYDLKNFFNNEGKNFTLNNFMDIFFFFEHLCFENLIEILQPEYKALIPEETKNKIIEKLVKQKDQNDKISIKNIASATRRLISRYLVGTSELIDIKEDRDLSFELSREELWEEKIGQLENLKEIIFSEIGEFKLTVGQAYEFYNIIGEEDRSTLKQYNGN